MFQVKHGLSLETVATVLRYTLPRLQRKLDPKHVASMVEDQALEFERYGCFSLLQSITVAQLGDRIYVLDGQHRVRAFEELHCRGLPVEHVVVPVVRYSVVSQAELASYYNRINQNMPVHPLELQDTWQDGFARPFLEWMERTYGAYIKRQTTVVRCPHLSLDQLKTELMTRSNMRVDVSRLCRCVQQFNQNVDVLCKEKDGAGFTDTLRKRIDECRKKAHGTTHHKNGGSSEGQGGGTCCYLGLFRRYEWLDACAFCANNNDTESVPPSTCWAMLLSVDRPLTSAARRSAIPMAVRRGVWAKVNHVDSNLGKCYTCESDLRFSDMECGHVVAHVLGGSSGIDNLMPVCRTCNRDMGIQNLETYKQRIREALNSDAMVTD